MAVALLALFVALGGSSYAALRIGSGQIVNNSVRSKDIRNNDVRSRDIRNFSLLAEDFQAGQLPRGPMGLPGPRGYTGATGPRGSTGSRGVSGLERVSMSSATDSTSPKQVTATCPAGKRAIGAAGGLAGGTGTSGTPPDATSEVVIYRIVPSPETTVPGDVTVTAFEEDPYGSNWQVEATALCADVSP